MTSTKKPLDPRITEQRNPRTAAIDVASALEIVDLINSEDRSVAAAVATQREAIARAIELAEHTFRSGGRLLYIGAGTSGRLGVLDAAECPPTFGTDPEMVQGLIAGGLSADTSKDLRLRLALDMLGVPYKYVTGYRSSPPARLALQRGEISMFSESPPSYRSVVEPSLVKTGQAMPVFYDEVADPPPPQRQLEGLTIPSFPQLYREIKGTLPSGPLWEAYRVLYDMNSTLQRMIALPPGTPPAALAALRAGIEGLNADKEFAAEATRTIEFAPDYPTAPDMSQKVRAMMVASPQMRDFINDYMRNPPKR